MTTESSGLYVHVPYCNRKCGYCDFFSEVRREDGAWVGAVEREFASHRGRFGELATVYLGGGTPSCLDPETITRLLDYLPRLDDAEVTLEANPDDVDAGRARAWFDAGVNRISLGVQSLRDDRLAFLGRRHDAEAARRAVHVIREAGCDNLSLDLIHGLPGDDGEVLEHELSELVALQPEHVSCYELSVAEGTPLSTDVIAGRAVMPPEDRSRELFLFASAFLRERGFEHYEISTFARSTGLRSQHNSAYWARHPYLGLGPTAHSFDGVRRWWNTAGVDRYLERIGRGLTAVTEEESLNDDQAALETLMLGLRTADGCDRSLLQRWPAAEAKAARLVNDDLLVLTEDRLAPTIEGMAIADDLPLLLM